jgi:NMD protein affecting ribosome stability and mRNA decay
MSPPTARVSRNLKEPAVCERCGAVFSHKTWRRDRRVTGELLSQATWTTCPACVQVEGKDQYFGRVLFRGPFANTDMETISRRIQNVARRASHTQPERRIVSINREGESFEVLTTSQKLAHRIVREVEKAFGGKTTYNWSDTDGTLFATWQAKPVRKTRKA